MMHQYKLSVMTGKWWGIINQKKIYVVLFGWGKQKIFINTNACKNHNIDSNELKIGL